MSLSENLKVSRERMGVTQAQLAKLTGVSQATISEIENGKTKEVSAKVLFQLADALSEDPRILIDADVDLLNPRPPFHDEEALLSLYRKLSPDDQRLLKALAQTMINIRPRGG